MAQTFNITKIVPGLAMELIQTKAAVSLCYLQTALKFVLHAEHYTLSLSHTIVSCHCLMPTNLTWLMAHGLLFVS